MATIPIEITIQDQASPITPTPSTNTETNITVPDTGAGTIGNNTFSSSSVASIIVPAVLLVLSLATVCTLLIHHHKHQGDKASKKQKLATSASATIAVLSATALLGSLIMPATKAATSDSEVSIEVPDKISIVVNREDDTTEATTEATAYITSTSAFGYKVLLSMADDTDTANLYLDGDTTSEYYIAPVAGEELEANTWGYALADDEAYSAIPLVDTPNIILEGTDSIEDGELTIHYGVNIDESLPTGSYLGEIEYAIVAESAPATIDTLIYMQDFATLSTKNKTNVLNSMTEGRQYILKDSRNNKDYFISKLADGNVWMTQNLDLDLSTTTELTPSDTDITGNWTPSNGTINFTGTTVEGWVNSNTAPYSANPGDIYYYTSGTTENDIQYNSLAECEAAGHTDCQHYHAGNYYNWSAAVASNDASDLTEQYSNAPNSICPAGWRLPTSRDSSSPDTGNFYNLLNMTGGILGEHTPSYMGNAYYYAEGGFNTSRTNPLWLIRSGYINNSLNNPGNNSGYWSSTLFSDERPFFLAFSNSSINPTTEGVLGRGYLIRCLVR